MVLIGIDYTGFWKIMPRKKPVFINIAGRTARGAFKSGFGAFFIETALRQALKMCSFCPLSGLVGA
jgi:hypothetical protein